MVIYRDRKKAEESARFTKGTVFALRDIKETILKEERKINPDGFIVVNPLPNYLWPEFNR